MLQLSLLFTLFAVSIISSHAIQCLNESGQPVEWWAIFKLPQGAQYMYYDTETPLAMSPYALNGTGGAMFETMNQLWASGATAQYAFYNDEPPNMTTYNFTVGHSKGAWMWDMTEIGRAHV